MKDFRVLKFLDRFKNLFEHLGVDYVIMRKILQIKLIMDGRRVPTVISSSNSKKAADDKNNFISSLWLYALIGLIMIPFTAGRKNYIYNMSFVFGIMLFMVITSLISDFSSVLLNVRDINIIASKPVSSKTLNTAKTIHVFIYMSMLTLSISAPAIITAVIKQTPLFVLLFLIELILMDLFIVVLTALLYFLILRFFDGEKLKDIINYVQILLSITLSVGYQLIGRLFHIANLNAVFTPKWWQYFIVPVWFGAPLELISGSYNINYAILSALAFVMPVISIVIYIKLMPSFEKSLQKLSNNSSKGSRNSMAFIEKLSNIVCREKQERVFFKFTSYMIKNEREFKLKVYPSLGFAVIFPFIFLFNELRNESFASIASSKLYLNIYFCAMLIPTIVMMIKYSGKYKAAWIYKTLPIKEISPVFKGSLKALIMQLLLPVYIGEAIIFTGIFGIRILPHLLLVLLNMAFFTVICFKLTKKALPFSVDLSNTKQSEALTTIPLMLALGVLAFVHYACISIPYGIYINMAVILAADILLWKKAFNIPIADLYY